MGGLIWHVTNNGKYGIKKIVRKILKDGFINNVKKRRNKK